MHILQLGMNQTIFSPGGVKLTTLTLDGNRICTPYLCSFISGGTVVLTLQKHNLLS